MRKGQKHLKDDVRTRALKIRLGNREFDELDAVAKELDITKAEITRTAIKEYLAKQNIEIWAN